MQTAQLQANGQYTLTQQRVGHVQEYKVTMLDCIGTMLIGMTQDTVNLLPLIKKFHKLMN